MEPALVMSVGGVFVDGSRNTKGPVSSWEGRLAANQTGFNGAEGNDCMLGKEITVNTEGREV